MRENRTSDSEVGETETNRSSLPLSLHHNTFITNPCRANFSLKTTQALARHNNIRLTMNVYSHIDQEEQAAAIGMLKGVE